MIKIEQPIFGHPGNIATLFPTSGLPIWLNSSGWNTRLLLRRDGIRRRNEWGERIPRGLDILDRVPYQYPVGV